MAFDVTFSSFPEGELYTFIKKYVERIVDENGICLVALSGGTTPFPLYERLFKSSLPWNDIHFFQVDERFVSSDHFDSNQGMIFRAIGKAEGINFHPIPVNMEPSDAVDSYCSELYTFFGANGFFDLVLLGLGEDGHTASIFPETDLSFCERSYCIVDSPSHLHRRITMTVEFINKSGEIVFLVKGENKIRVLKKLLDRDRAVVASMIRDGSRIFTDVTTL